MKSSRAQTRASFHRIPTLAFERQSRLTSYGGLVVFWALFRALDLKNRLRRCFCHLSPHGMFGHTVAVLLLVVHLLLGFRRLRGLDCYRGDPLVARVLGLRRLPDVSTMSRVLASMDEVAVDNLRFESRELVLERLERERLARVTLDFDGSVQSTKGHAEGTAVGFNKRKKGSRSYYPLFCTVAQVGQFLDFHHRSGNVHDSNGARGFMRRCFSVVRGRCPDAALETRVDSAFFSDAILTMLDKEKVDYTCSVPFERFCELKGLVQEQQEWTSIDDRWSFAELSWKPKSWESDRRLLVLRQRRAVQQKGPIQLDLFVPVDFDYDYRVVVTNKRQSARAVLLFHHGRGSQEKLFGEGKQHAALDVIPTRRKCGNQVFTLAGMMAHNLTRELQMRANPTRCGTEPKRPARWQFLSLGALRQRLLHRAGRLTRPQGRLTLTLSSEPVVEQEMRRYLDALDAAA